jgi:hypothetical protein
MTPEEINKTIAEYCGWTDIEPEFERIGIQDLPNGELRGITPKGNSCVLPDYFNCLNAMHEAELLLQSRLDFNGICVWLDNLYREHGLNPWVWRNGPKNTPPVEMAQIVTLNSNKRATAFVKTIGKWKE